MRTRLGISERVLQPAADKWGVELGAGAGHRQCAYTLDLRVPLKRELVAAYFDLSGSNKVDKPTSGIAAHRSSAGRNYSPVVIAVWDSGVDSALFGKKRCAAATASRADRLRQVSEPRGTTELQVVSPDVRQAVAADEGAHQVFGPAIERGEQRGGRGQAVHLDPVEEQYKPAIEELILPAITNTARTGGIAVREIHTRGC